MSGRYDIVFSKDFADDLRGIGGYVERVSGSPETSRRQLRRIRNAAKGLTSMPKRHPIVDEGIASQLGLSKATVGNYAIFYRVDDESRKVLVDRVIYGRRSLGGHAG
jgi:plasmid stabilization system protein ParE